MKQCFLFFTNKSEDTVLSAFHNIRDATAPLGEAFFILQDNSIKTSIWKINYVPLVDYYLRNPFYDHYWYIENEVRFTGDWATFFKSFSFSKADFISCHIRTFREEPKWQWWHSLSHEGIYIPLFARVRSFNPIFRISRQALQYIHNALCDQWRGHTEVLLPTLLYLEGMRIMDFGGTGQFVNPGNENRFYTSISDMYGVIHEGTVSCMPVVPTEKIDQNKIYYRFAGK